MSTRDQLQRAADAEHRLIEPVMALEDSKVVRALTPLAKAMDEPPLMAIAIVTLTAGALARQPVVARVGARMLAAHLVANALKTVLKGSVDRLRPGAVEERAEIRPGTGTDDKEANAFPSGHTAGAVAVAQAVAHELPHYGVPARVVAVIAGATQVPRGAHYLTDVVSGAAVGWLSERIAGYALAHAERTARDRLMR